MKIRISTGPNSHQGVGIDDFAREVEKRNGGRDKVQTFHSGPLGGERESIEAVQLGTQGLTSRGPVPNFVPAARILDIALLFRDKAPAHAAALDGPIGPIGPIGQDILKEFDSKGFKALARAESGVRHMTSSQRAVNAAQDLKGLTMRAMESAVHVAACKGIITTPMAFPEVFTTRQQGAVEGQESHFAAGLGLWRIVTRLIIERPAERTEVLVRFRLICLVFLDIPMAFRRGAMVRGGHGVPLERRPHAALSDQDGGRRGAALLIGGALTFLVYLWCKCKGCGKNDGDGRRPLGSGASDLALWPTAAPRSGSRARSRPARRSTCWRRVRTSSCSSRCRACAASPPPAPAWRC